MNCLKYGFLLYFVTTTCFEIGRVWSRVTCAGTVLGRGSVLVLGIGENGLEPNPQDEDERPDIRGPCPASATRARGGASRPNPALY